MNVSRILLIVAFAFVTGQSRASADVKSLNNAKFSPVILDDVPPSLRRSLTKELEVFNRAIKKSDADKSAQLSLADADFVTLNRKLSEWLSQRIKFLVSSENEIFKSRAIQTMNFEIPNLLPLTHRSIGDTVSDSSLIGVDEITDISTTKATDSSADTSIDSSGNEIVVVMNNLGAELYLKQKAQNQFWNLSLSQDFKNIALLSPRVGIVEVGRALFSFERLIDQSNRDSMANHLARWMVLIHEGRHSDGRGKFLSFAHSPCPSGHDYEGLLACDRSTRGANAFGHEFLKTSSMECFNCGVAEFEALKLISLDSANRILPDAEVPSEVEEAAEFFNFNSPQTTELSQ